MIPVDWYYYRKYILNNFVDIEMCKTSNYEIPKNCPYYFLTNDVYVIGYHVQVGDEVFEYPVFDNVRGKKHNRNMVEIRKIGIKSALYDCYFPDTVVKRILEFCE